MKISKQALREARQLFRNCLVNGRLDESRVRRAVDEVLAQKPRGYLEIVSRLHRLVKIEVERRTATVESATPLPADLQAEVTARIRKIYGTEAQVSFRPNPALIGGMRVRVGSDLYDGSVENRLKQLAQVF